MSKRKLGRFAGLVFALAVAFGVIGTGTVSAESTQAEVLNIVNWEWS
ncbi:hypothetical protein [Actinoplanes subglobosus]|uniref:Chitinase n=1 Tax=Actinoplanes subglobosus TaxID=1547892 RepID=A0ABV8IQY3_9ACTN